MGGTDENNMTARIVDIMDTLNEKFKAIIIAGPGYPYLNQLKSRLAHACFDFKLLIDPVDVAQVMAQSTLAIISFGQTAYELAALKIPAIYLCLTQDHYDSSMLFEKTGLGTSLGIYSKVKKRALIGSLLMLLHNEGITTDKSPANSINISDLKQVSNIILGCYT